MKRTLIILGLLVFTFAASAQSVPEPQAVDLGLTVKWASFNLGASNCYENGFFYAWGETEPKEDYTKDNYRLSLSDDGNYNIQLKDDPAHKALGGKWRVPTIKEWTDLKKYCEWKWHYTSDGVFGYMITSKITGKSIYISCSGYMKGGKHLRNGDEAYYLTTELNESNPERAWIFDFNSINDGDTWSFDRWSGYSVRPVCEK